ncbi:MAG: alpha,alpha-trehalase TreF [Chitinophagaceae bacterium]|nr:alpha,alpha-trehalase TreF [Chitinophagaceae bacterium]
MAAKLIYIEDLSPLYEDVQAAHLFSDSKYFVDCTPKTSPEEILLAYIRQKDQPGFSLADFIEEYFTPPEEPASNYSSTDRSLEDHINALWDVLTRTTGEGSGTLIPLPHPYVVPGGRFREVYYWDSYFTMLGLQASGRIDLIEHMVNNFAHLIDTFGFIPNGNRSYYLGRSQPPFFSLMVTILVEEKGKEILSRYRSQLEKEYQFWMDGEEIVSATNPTHRRVVLLQDGSILNRYWDDNDTPRPEAFIEDTKLAARSGKEPSLVFRHVRAAAESGWDFSSRWFRDGKDMSTIQTTDIIPIDLNCLLLFHEIALCTIYENEQEPERMEKMLKRVMHRNRAIDTYCWNAEKGFYFDYQYKDRRSTGAYTLAAVYPLFFNLASPEQSAGVASFVLENFVQPGGLISTLTLTGEQWDAPNGWAPLQWIAYKAFLKNGHTELAHLVRGNWMRTNEKVYAATGKMMEKYNVADPDAKAGGGEYPNQDGFGWTNGVYMKMRG